MFVSSFQRDVGMYYSAVYKFGSRGRLGDREPNPKFWGGISISSKLIELRRLRRICKGMCESTMRPYKISVRAEDVRARGCHAKF